MDQCAASSGTHPGVVQLLRRVLPARPAAIAGPLPTRRRTPLAAAGRLCHLGQRRPGLVVPLLLCQVPRYPPAVGRE